MALTERVLKAAKIINVVLTYWVVSISMVFFNKHLVGGVGSGSGQPDVAIFIAWAQSIFSVIFIIVYSNIGGMISTSIKVSWLLGG